MAAQCRLVARGADPLLRIHFRHPALRPRPLAVVAETASLTWNAAAPLGSALLLLKGFHSSGPRLGTIN